MLLDDYLGRRKRGFRVAGDSRRPGKSAHGRVAWACARPGGDTEIRDSSLGVLQRDGRIRTG